MENANWFDLLLQRLEAFENWQEARLRGGFLRIGERELSEFDLQERWQLADARVQAAKASAVC